MARGKLLSTEIVLNKAYEMARENGIASVTYNGLARELEIRPQSMYRYVKDLKTLRVWLLSRFLDELVERIGTAMAGLSPTRALRAFAVTMYDECHTNPRYYETFELMHSYDSVEDLRPSLLALCALIQEPMERLGGQSQDTMRHIQLFVAVNLGYAQMSMTHFPPISLRDDREAFVRSIEEFILNALPGSDK